MAADPNLNLQDLARILSQISRQSSTLSTNVRDVSEILANFKQPLNKYEQYIKELRSLGSEEVNRRAELLLQLKRASEDQKKVAANKKLEIARLEEDIKNTANARRRANAEVKKLMAKYGEFAEITEGPKEKAQQLKTTLDQLKKQLKVANGEHSQYSNKLNRINQIIQLREKELANVSFKEAGKNFVSKVEKSIVDGIQQIFNVNRLKDTATDLYKNTKREINTGVEVASFRNGLFNDDFRLAMMGTDRAGAIEAAKRNRGAYVAAGGMNQSMNVVKTLEDSVKGITTLDERFDYAADQMSILAQAGIKPTIKNASLLTSSFASLRKTAGLTGQEFNTMMTDLVNDSDVQYQLRLATTQAERESILKSIAARTAEAKQMGLTLEQSKAMAKASMKQMNDPALKRIQDAARMQAMMGAMGISGGQRIAELMRKKTRTPTEQREYDAMMQTVNAQAQQMRKAGIGSELFVDQLIEKLDTGPVKVTDPNSAYSKQYVEALKSTNESISGLGEVSTGLKDSIELLTKAINAWNMPGTQLLAGAGGAVPWASSAFGGGAGALAMYKFMKARQGVGGVGTGAAGSGAGAAAGGWANKGKAFLKSGAAKGGLAGIVGGLGADYAADKFRESGHDTAGNISEILGSALTWGGTGAMAGGAIGGLGAVPGAVIGAIAGAGMKAYEIYGGSDTKNPSVNEAADVASSRTADAVTQQLSKMDKSNEYLQKLADTVPRMVELQEKQLQATMMTEQERKDSVSKSKLMNTNSRFTPRYGYVY